MITQNTHFAIGLHVLTALACDERTPIASPQLAKSVATHPVFLRAVIGELREAGLVKTKKGKGGGALLGRAADEITLLDVYRATEERRGLCQHDCSDSACPVANNVTSILRDLSKRLDHVIAQELRQTTIAALAQRVGAQPDGASLGETLTLS